MVVKLTETQVMYFRSMGKALRITAIADSDADANEYCAKHRDEGVIATVEPLVFMANLYDHGTPIPKQ